MFDRTAPFTSIETQSILDLSDAAYDSAIRSGYLQSSGTIRSEPPCTLLFHTCWDMLRYKILTEDLTALNFDDHLQKRLDETLDGIYDMIVDYSPSEIISQLTEEIYMMLVEVAQAQGYWTAHGIAKLTRSVFHRIFDEDEGEISIMKRHLSLVGPVSLATA